MTHGLSPAEDGLEPFGVPSAVDAYRDRFGADALPHLFDCPDMELAERMLRVAVARGEPLGGWDMMAACGISQPPPDAEI